MPRPASTTARGYGAPHQRTRAQWAPLVATGTVRCARCRRPILAGAPWDLGHHDDNRHVYTGPEHQACNRAAGARKGNRMRRWRPRPTTPPPALRQPPTAARW